MNSNRSRSVTHLGAPSWVVAGIVLFASATSLLAAAPAWWVARGAVASGGAGSANDYAAVNQGQLKNFAGAASKEMEAMLPGGAGTVLDMPLNPSKELKCLTVRTLANEVVIGLMGVTLAR